MFKKRYLSIFVIIILLFSFVAVVAITQAVAMKNEQSQMIEVCRNALSSALSSDRPGYTSYSCGDTVIYSPIRYEKTKFSVLSVTVYFDDGTNDMWCDAQWRGLEWVVIGWGSTIVGMCP